MASENNLLKVATMFMRPIVKFMVKWFPWSMIKNVGGSSVASLLLLIPVFGYILIFSDQILRIVGIGEVGLSLATPATGTASTLNILSENDLKLAYIGLWMIGAATIGYRLFCPTTIRTAKDEANFVATSIGLSNRTYYELLLKDLRRRVWYDVSIDGIDAARSLTHHSKTFSTGADARDSRELVREQWLEKNYDGLVLSYGCLFRRHDFQLAPLRWCIMAVYATGFILTIVPSVRTLMNVISSLPQIN